jgi:hypothetical protein
MVLIFSRVLFLESVCFNISGKWTILAQILKSSKVTKNKCSTETSEGLNLIFRGDNLKERMKNVEQAGLFYENS